MAPPKSDRPSFLDRLSVVLGTLFGSGLSPVMPGTCGALLASLLIVWIPGSSYGWSTALLFVASTAFGPALADRMIRRSGMKDPQSFVLDEGAGIWLAAFRPTNPGIEVVAVAFLAFRVLDITKPWPIRRLERLPGGYGVVYDDVFAGLLALGVSYAVEVTLLS